MKLEVLSVNVSYVRFSVLGTWYEKETILRLTGQTIIRLENQLRMALQKLKERKGS